jgi:DNA-binding protein HU-beta
MNKKELIDIIFHETDMTKKEIDLVITKFLETIMNSVSKGEKVQLVGFGAFSCLKRKIYINPLLEENIMKKRSSSLIIRFSPGKFFKEKINVS